MASYNLAVLPDDHDKVILHQFPRFGPLPNLFPPCLKLETYLRMTSIPHECSFAMKASTKGKMPWIEYKGKEIGDFNFFLKFLNQEFGVDVDDHLTVEQKGMARALCVMLEESTYWSLVYHRWCSSKSKESQSSISAACDYFTCRTKYKRREETFLQGHGIGRLSEEEIYGIADKDLKAVSGCLGENKFLFGDKPCLADAALFALVSNLIWYLPESPPGKLILTQLKNLEDHSKRVKEAFYPDWDEVTSAGKKTA